MTRIIGLIGPAGCGKSTVAHYLRDNHGYRIAPMAGPLKSMLRAVGLRHSDVYGEHKEDPSPLLGGLTPRHAMQTLGTEWGRDQMDENFWVRLWLHKYISAPEEAGGRQPIVVDDIRFQNEIDLLFDLGARIVGVEGRNERVGEAAHRSEAGTFSLPDNYLTISNAGSKVELTAAIEKLLRRVL